MPPKVAPQQVVVIPIPNSKMTEDASKVGPLTLALAYTASYIGFAACN